MLLELSLFRAELLPLQITLLPFPTLKCPREADHDGPPTPFLALWLLARLGQWGAP